MLFLLNSLLNCNCNFEYLLSIVFNIDIITIILLTRFHPSLENHIAKLFGGLYAYTAERRYAESAAGRNVRA